MTARRTLVIRRLIRASREDIFAMWTDARSLQRWMTPGIGSRTTAELDPRVGGRDKIVMHSDRDFDHHGEYLVVDPPSKLSFTWISEGSEYRRSVVTVELLEKGANQTELVLTHEQLPPAQVAPAHARVDRDRGQAGGATGVDVSAENTERAAMTAWIVSVLVVLTRATPALLAAP